METRIVEQIISYLNEEKYRQAILIDGEWGSGKTFFVKEVLMPQISNLLFSFPIFLSMISST